MGPMTADVLVVGAGALGLGVADALATGGARVTVIDDPARPAASAVAAGMLAPAFESALDPLMAPHSALLLAARRAWTEVADRCGIRLIRDGAAWRGGEVEALARRLRIHGFQAEVRTDASLFTPDDWRLDPKAASSSLAGREGVTLKAGIVRAVAPGEVTLADGERLVAGTVVVASGALGNDLMDLPIQPIRGQIATVAGLTLAHVIRTPDGYVVPVSSGTALVGATMEAGSRRLEPEPGPMADFVDRVGRWVPDLAGATLAEVRVGVRGATADGLPLAGQIAPGLAVALAPRRNGWLLAPLVGQVVASALMGQAHASADLLDPRRFSPPQS